MGDQIQLFSFLFSDGQAGMTFVIIGIIVLFFIVVVVVSLRVRRFGHEAGQEELERRSFSVVRKTIAVLGFLLFVFWLMGMYGNYLAGIEG